MECIELITVKELLDGKVLSMTFRHVQLAPSYIVRAVRILDGAFNKRQPVQKVHNLPHKVDFHRGEYAIL